MLASFLYYIIPVHGGLMERLPNGVTVFTRHFLRLRSSIVYTVASSIISKNASYVDFFLSRYSVSLTDDYNYERLFFFSLFFLT